MKNTRTSNKSKSTIILLSNEVQVRIGNGTLSLEPDRLRSCVDKALRQRTHRDSKEPLNSIEIMSYLDELVGALGFESDFYYYCNTHYPAIEAFLANKGAIKPADLITPRRSAHGRNQGIYLADVGLSRQDVSERLFFSGLDLPVRMFTGYNFDFWKCWHDGLYLFDELTVYPCKVPLTVPLKRWSGTDAINANILLARERGQEEIETGRTEYPTRQIIDVLLAGSFYHFHKHFHLFGDMRFENSDGRCSGTLMHCIDAGSTDDNFDQCDKPIIELFRYRLADECFGRYGWVDIIEYNKSLILLKGTRGEFDWIIRNQRNNLFDTHVYGQEINARDMPKSAPDYSFERWLHFEHTGWKGMDLQQALRARKTYPVQGSGGTLVSNGYETDRELLIKFYSRNGEFVSNSRCSSTLHPNYLSVDIGYRRLAISPLITIGQLIQRHSKMNCDSLPEGDDSLWQVNSDKNQDLPAAATWAAVQRYLKSEENLLKVPCRLLTETEYRLMRKGENTNLKKRSNEPLLQFFEPDGNKYENHPPYMPEKDFQSLFFRYRRQPEWIEHSNGIRAVDSDEIVEWLQSGAGIASRNLVCPSSGRSGMPLRRLAPGSTGKYKGRKYVFRICYELTLDS